MTKLTDLLDRGVDVRISHKVSEGGLFYNVEDGTGQETMVVNPMDYVYMAFDNPFDAHEINMRIILNKIEASARTATDRIDEMADYLNKRNDPKMVAFDRPYRVEVNGTEFIFTPTDEGIIG